MRRLMPVLATCILMSSISRGLKDDGNINTLREEMCTDRNTSVNLHGCGEGEFFATMFTYNETSHTCYELPESICTRSEDYGVFYNIFTCAHTCNGGKGLELCLLTPYKPANGTCTEKEFILSSDKSCDPNIAWFYNISSEECEKYATCLNPWKFPTDVNGFAKPYFCMKYCGKFHVNNINGSENRSDTVNCTGEPPARCPSDETEYGETRYFYNESAEECQKYLACEYDWPKGLGAINYFVTNRSCQLECGNYNSSEYQLKVAARDDLFAQENEYSLEVE
uniref:Putative secreted protein n=1 Tax=Amblyomma parvum TaxID=251391 RepID=A0A023G0R4_AMBPA